MPITRLGGGAAAATCSSNTSRAVGALPISTNGAGRLVDSSFQARCIPTAVRVDPGGA